MKLKVLPKKRPGQKELHRQAASLDDAWHKGLFSGNMSYYEFRDRISKKNPQLKFILRRNHSSIWNGNKFITGFSNLGIIPRFSIAKLDPSKIKTVQYTDAHGDKTSKQEVNQDEEDGKILIRSWIAIFNDLKRRGYEIVDDDLSY